MTSPHRAEEPPEKKRPLRGSTIVGLAAGGATVIAAAAIIVPLIVAGADKDSDVDSLQVRGNDSTQDSENELLAQLPVIGGPEQRDYPDDYIPFDWRIPVSAPIETFPLALAYGTSNTARCSPEQGAWLEEHAHPIDSSITGIVLHNDASTGGAISLTNLRYVAEDHEAEPWIRFSCPSPAAGGPSGQGIELPIDGSPAVWSEDGYGDPPEVPGSPVTINLEPGEILHSYISETGSSDVDRIGNVVADLADGSGSVIVFEGLRVDRQRAIGFEIGYIYDRYQEQLVCAMTEEVGPAPWYWIGYDHYVPCDLGEAADLLRAAAGSAR